MKMYENNIYIKNHEELKSYGTDIGIAFEQFDTKHGLEYNEKAQAEYRYWRAKETGVPELLSAKDKLILGLKDNEI